MPCCPNCGKVLEAKAKYCINCGKLIGASFEEGSAKRKQEYAGSVIRCPACGEELPSLTAICTACGHEINRGEVSISVQEFTEAIDRCDQRIAQEPTSPTKGWSTWSRRARKWWVFFNIVTLCFPIVLSLVISMLRTGATPSLSVGEKKKAAIIENSTFPNERGPILEALLFVEGKTDYLASEKLNRKTAFWMRLWVAKGKQLYHKAQILIPDDTIAQDAYNEITESSKRVQTMVGRKMAAGVTILVLFLSIVGTCIVSIINPFAFVNTGSGKQGYSKIQTWPEAGLATRLPAPKIDIHGEVVSDNDECFEIYLSPVAIEQYEDYLENCQQLGYSVGADKGDNTYEGYNASGYRLYLSHSKN